nr:hypothetical protein [Clostridia bacterium]
MYKNLELYNRYAQPPESALKSFSNGKFSGTDINPMWRIQALTESFGPCGIGWYTEIERQWREDTDDGTATVYCHISLYINVDGKWSKPITGVGGNTLSRKGKNGVTTTDEAYKMAYTDAMGIACKALGIGANIWWKHDRTKYTAQDDAGDKGTPPPSAPKNDPHPPPPSVDINKEIARIKTRYGKDGFAQMRASLIAGGVIRDIPSDQMTEKDWLDLINAIDFNFGDDAA